MAGTKAVDNFPPGFNFDAPLEHLDTVTPSDVNELAHVCRRIFITGAGNIAVIARGDTVACVIPVIAGQILDICVRQIKATGTTATGIVAGW